MKKSTFLTRFIYSVTLILVISIMGSCNQPRDRIVIDLNHGSEVSPIVYGWHYEEIGMIGEGGLYAEMVRNRGLEEANPPRGLEVKDGVYANVPDPENPRKKVYEMDPLTGWSLFPQEHSGMALSRVDTHPFNPFNPHSLQIDIQEVREIPDGGVVNAGFFGMYFRQGNTYDLSFFVRADDFDGPLEVLIIDSLGTKLSEPVRLDDLNGDWKEYAVSFTANATTDHGRLLFRPLSAGKVWLDVVSMFPGDTWDNGKSVFRADIMQNLKDYAPDFIRFPGGCLVHGVSEGTMYHWKETIGDIAERPGGWSKWSPNYRTDGLGYHEFYELCEYLGADAMYVTPSGLVCTGWVFRDGETDHYHHPDVDVNAYIQDALDAIEYAIGPVTSTWGAERAKNGHPEPFPLKYIEIGNEDFGPMYYANYDAFYRAIHARYPDLKIIANSIIGNTPDQTDKRKRLPEFKDLSTVKIFDEHYYKDLDWVIENYHRFDAYHRPGPDLFIGELGIQGPHPLDVLGESVFMLSMERNADMNPMMADRPLMRNWTFVEGKGNPLYYHTNSTSFKTFNYYMSKLFRDHKIDLLYETGYQQNGSSPEVDREFLFSTAGREPGTGDLIIKIVNLTDQHRETELAAEGFKSEGKAVITVLTAENDQNNTPENPQNVMPDVQEIDFAFPEHLTVKPRSLTIIRVREAKES